jgi:guanylate kinase
VEALVTSSPSNTPEFKGKVIIFSAPSGAGKTTIVRHLLDKHPEFGFSISACTRSRRPHEIDGRDYYFLSIAAFRQKIEAKAFVEWEEVYAGSFYGTLQAEVERLWAAGKHVLFDVDVKGGLNLKKYYGELALAVFVSVSDVATLEQRLRYRNTESEEKIQTRLAKAQAEMAYSTAFDVVLENSNLPDTLLQAEQITRKFTAQA